ncbi:hypothetical protein BD847_1139 [Flavobacterium cutihirudinis]|uniref:Uncharacterized protein n=1 Tax=Flavobacterium cutihirudinis TaxID=1265740 RepID=A0A3D9G211_9FLAO|nr:hypothetical protein BD847_1139 [Flavobacterium cutihirudinis]
MSKLKILIVGLTTIFTLMKFSKDGFCNEFVLSNSSKIPVSSKYNL